MFGFFKQKLKDALSKFSNDVKKEGKEEVIEKEEVKEVIKEEPKKGVRKVQEHAELHPKELKQEHKEKPQETVSHEIKVKVKEPEEEAKEEPKEEKKGFFSKIKNTFSFGKKKEEEKEEKEEAKEYSKEEPEQEEKQIKVKAPKEELVHIHTHKVHEEIKERKQEKTKEHKEEIKAEEKKQAHPVHVEPKVIISEPVEEAKKKQVIEEKPAHKQKQDYRPEIKAEPKQEVKAGLKQGLKLEPKTIKREEFKEIKREEIKEARVLPEARRTEQIHPIPQVKETRKEEPKVEIKHKEEKIEKPKEEKKMGFFEKVKETFTKTTLSEEKFNEIFWELEVAFLENNVAVEVIEKIKSDLREELVDEKVHRGKIEEVIIETLGKSINGLFDVEQLDLLEKIREKKPYIIMFIGVNGSGKTTNLAKVANYLQNNGLKCVIAACDTFRAAAIQQIENHANNLNIKIIKQGYGADSAAVAFDTIQHAKSRGCDVVLIDTAGRSHSNTNLMDELKKVERVAKPDLTIFVGDSLTGNDVVEQARSFGEKIGFDGIILAKADIDEKGGAAISVSYVTGKPIIFIGTGQEYKDLKKFDKSFVMNNLGLSA